MDAVHEPDRRHFIGKPIKVAEFKQSVVELLEKLPGGNEDDDSENFKTAMMRRMDIPEWQLAQLEKECSPEHLCCGEEPIDPAEIPSGVDLKTVRLRKQDLEKRAKDRSYRHKTNRMLRTLSSPSATTLVPGDSDAKSLRPDERAARNEVVLFVQVFKPMKEPAVPNKYRTRGFMNYKVQVELAVLGCQKLNTLRTRIPCISDAAVLGEFSDDPKKPHEPTASHVYKSGFFYIEGTFYNDMSDPSCRDYSEVIREWAEDPRRKVGPFKTAPMEETKFEDLEMRLGYPYVYRHQGSCEHLMVFSDLRMIHPGDNQRLADYPVILMSPQHGQRDVRCMLCKKTNATWVTYENERVVDDPFFYCKECFLSYNYTADGQKIGRFRARPYLGWSVVS